MGYASQCKAPSSFSFSYDAVKLKAALFTTLHRHTESSSLAALSNVKEEKRQGCLFLVSIPTRTTKTKTKFKRKGTENVLGWEKHGPGKGPALHMYRSKLKKKEIKKGTDSESNPAQVFDKVSVSMEVNGGTSNATHPPGTVYGHGHDQKEKEKKTSIPSQWKPYVPFFMHSFL